jgi:ABC-2 type transport system ATP-binding protein
VANAIETSNLTKYYGAKCGIDGLNLTVESGEVFGFIGPNGAGKTTTIRTLLDIIFPTDGSARIFGLDCHTDSRRIKREIGYLPSDDHFYQSMTGNELLEYGARIRNLDRDRARKRIGDLADRLEADLGANIKTLSRGNRRKISIINALLPEPKLLILDEPTSGLDPLMQTRFFELITAEQERGATVFFSSHVLSEVQKTCTRVAIIKNGHIVRTDRIDAMARERLKRVVLEPKPGQSLGALPINGAEEVQRQGGTVRFMYSGTATDLLAALSEPALRDKLDDVSIERSTLDEIFMEYYQDEEPGAEP